MFGPYDNSIVHDPEDGYLEYYEALSTPDDVLVEAVFLNPYAESDKAWQHSFRLKGGRSNYRYTVAINSDGDLGHYVKLGDNNYFGTLFQPVEAINTSPGGKNLLQVVMAHGLAWVYVNEEFVTSFPMDRDTGGNEIGINVYDDHQGRTSFEDMAVWRWDESMREDFPQVAVDYVPPPTPTPDPSVPVHGPESGTIRHDPEDGRLAVHRGPNITGDIMVEVSFEVPYEPRESNVNFAIFLDDKASGTYQVIEVSSIFGGSWFHWRKAGPDAEWKGNRAEDVPGLNLQKGEWNRIRLIIEDLNGWVFVNDRRVGIANLSLGTPLDLDDVRLLIYDYATGDFSYKQGDYTRFENFTVWRWHPSLYDLED